MKFDKGLRLAVLFILTAGMCFTISADNKREDYDKVTRMKIEANGHVFIAVLVDNSTTVELRKMLSTGPVTIEMEDYGNMEKVGNFDHSLPRNDEQIRTEAGDLILYNGRAFVIYYDTNSWNFTRIGRIEGVTGEGLKRMLGPGDVTVTLYLD